MLPVSSDAYFGHPPPPQIHVIQLPINGNIYLGAAVTKRCVSAKLWGERVSAGDSVEILCLATPEAETDDEEEEITCATVLALDPEIKGSDSTIYVSIVVGTNFNRVLSMEVQIEKDENETFVLHQGLPPFEPLPLDPRGEEVAGDDASVHSMTSDASRHGRRGMNDSFRNSQHGTKDSCGCSGPTLKKDGSTKHDGPSHKFRPSGGVTNLMPYRVYLHEDAYLTSVLWVAYGDGTTVRVHHGAFFSSVVHDDNFRDVLAKAVLRSRVLLPPSVEGITVVPLPKYHPSPLAPLPPWKPPRQGNDEMGSPASTAAESDDEQDPHNDEEMEDVVPEFHEALVYGGDPSTGVGEQFPSLAFYTSENQFVGRVTGENLRGVRNASLEQDAALLDHVIGGTTALVSGVFGSALGVVKWGLGQGDKVRICICINCILFLPFFRIVFLTQCLCNREVSGKG
jgi:hypothetical protein